MSEEIALADATLAELARLTITITSLRKTITQQQGEIAAARMVVAQVRWAVQSKYAPPPLCDALLAYDIAMEASTTL